MAQGKPVALITGASSGRGKDISLRLLQEGYTVYGAARRVERMSDIEAAGGHALPMDMTDDEAMADARRQMEINLFGLARLIQLCLPHMRAQHSGKIVNISSIGGKVAFPLNGWYNASKFALEGYSDSLRMEVRPFGIDVILIEPGSIEREWIGIAANEAERISGRGPYADLVGRVTKSMRGMKGAPPRAITDLIVTALRAPIPRTRYHTGSMAGLMLFMREGLPDRMLDRLVMSGLK